MDEIDDQDPITPYSPHRHISEISFTTVGNEYEKLLENLNNSKENQNSTEEEEEKNPIGIRDMMKLESRLFWLQLSSELSKVNDMQNVFLYLQWAKLEPKRNHNLLKSYFKQWKRKIQVHRWEIFSNAILAKKQKINLNQAREQVKYARVKLASEKFRTYIDKGEIISNNIDDSNLRIDCNNFIMNENNKALNTEENSNDVEFENHRNLLIIDPIRILGEQAVPLKELERINNLTRKPEKPVPRILTSPRQFYSPENNYNSKPIFDSPTYSPTSQMNKKRKVKKQNIAYENVDQINDEAEVEIREIIFDIEEEEEADDSDEVKLQKKIQNKTSKKSGLPYYLYFIVFLLFLSIGFVTFMLITPQNGNRRSKDL